MYNFAACSETTHPKLQFTVPRVTIGGGMSVGHRAGGRGGRLPDGDGASGALDLREVRKDSEEDVGGILRVIPRNKDELLSYLGAGPRVALEGAQVGGVLDSEGVLGGLGRL